MTKAIGFDEQQALELIEKTLTELHTHQEARAAKLACRIIPGLTGEDLLNPDTFPAVIRDPEFMFEHGQAAGILAAKMALRSRIRELG